MQFNDSVWSKGFIFPGFPALFYYLSFYSSVSVSFKILTEIKLKTLCNFARLIFAKKLDVINHLSVIANIMDINQKSEVFKIDILSDNDSNLVF